MKKIIYFLFLISFTIITLQITPILSEFASTLFFMSVVIISLLGLFNVNKLMITPTFLYFNILISISMILSGLIIGSLRTAINGLLFFSFYFVYSVVIPTNISKKKLEPYYLGSILIYSIMIIIPYFLGINNTIYMSYSGLFINSNSLGFISSTLAVFVFASLIGRIENKLLYDMFLNMFQVIVEFILFIFSVYISLQTASRTSFISILTIILFILIISLYKNIKEKNVGFNIIRLTLASPILIIIFWVIDNVFGISETFSSNIVSKFILRENDLLSGRGMSWSATFDNAGLFGKGQYFFLENVGLGSHSTFIDVLGIHGWITFVLFLLLIVYIIYVNYIFSLKNRSNLKYLPIASILGFVISSLGETITYQGSMIIAFISVSCVLSSKGESNNEKKYINEDI